MRRLLQMLAVLIALGVLASWLATGAHRGWTQTSVKKVTVDEITGLDAISYEDKLIVGLEVLGSGIFGAGLLGGASLLFRKPKPLNSQPKEAQANA
jgi:hypothetical protein